MAELTEGEQERVRMAMRPGENERKCGARTFAAILARESQELSAELSRTVPAFGGLARLRFASPLQRHKIAKGLSGMLGQPLYG